MAEGRSRSGKGPSFYGTARTLIEMAHLPDRGYKRPGYRKCQMRFLDLVRFEFER